MKQIDGIPSLILCALFWSTGGILVKLVDWNPFAIATIRSLIAGIFIAITIKGAPLFRIKKEDGTTAPKGTACLWAAGICYSLTMILYVSANKLTTAANTILLQYTNPVYIILFGPLMLGEKNRKSDYLAALGVTAGMILFFSDGLESGNQTGNILAACSGLTFGFTTLFMRKQQIYGCSSAHSFMIAHILTLAAGIPFMISAGMPSAKSCAGLVLLGIFQMGIPSVTYSLGIKRVRALTASFITMLEPLMNPVWVIIFAGEYPSVKCAAGGALILGTIAARAVFQHKSARTRN